jgi:hypothetical protein
VDLLVVIQATVDVVCEVDADLVLSVLLSFLLSFLGPAGEERGGKRVDAHQRI